MSSKTKTSSNKLSYFLAFVGIIFSITLILFSLLYFFTPKNFRNPKQDHSHFRMQYVFLGQAEDFGSPRYQVDYLKDVCDGRLAESPIHFHDNKNHFVHLHWQRVTGGQVLKFYGLNKIGGLDNQMGVKIDDLSKFKFTPIPIHSNSLPNPRPDDKFWVYTGDRNNYQKRNFEDFLKQDLETFFSKNSIIREQREEAEKESFNPIKIEVEAHNGVEHKTLNEAEQHEQDEKMIQKEKTEIENKNNQNNATSNEKNNSLNSQTSSSTSNNNSSSNFSTDKEPAASQEDLKEVNNLLGDIIIFVQPDEPTNEQVRVRFDSLEPLGLSVCGG